MACVPAVPRVSSASRPGRAPVVPGGPVPLTRPLGAAERARLNYGVFSARFGNLYTTRQLLQLQTGLITVLVGLRRVVDNCLQSGALGSELLSQLHTLDFTIDE